MESNSSKQALLAYRLSFGNIIGKKDNQPAMLQLVQGERLDVSDSNNVYHLLLCGVKMNRKIYQPTEIEAELYITQSITDTTGKTASSAPKFVNVENKKVVRRREDLDGFAANNDVVCYSMKLGQSDD